MRASFQALSHCSVDDRSRLFGGIAFQTCTASGTEESKGLLIPADLGRVASISISREYL